MKKTRYTEIESSTLYRYHRNSAENFAGNFMHEENKNSDYTIYALDEFDQKLTAVLPLKTNEKIFRCDTEMTRQMKYLGPYLVKINVEKCLVYFLEENNDTEQIIFKSRGVKMTYFNHYVNFEK